MTQKIVENKNHKNRFLILSYLAEKKIYEENENLYKRLLHKYLKINSLITIITYREPFISAKKLDQEFKDREKIAENMHNVKRIKYYTDKHKQKSELSLSNSNCNSNNDITLPMILKVKLII